jgi:hypothetical protein
MRREPLCALLAAAGVAVLAAGPACAEPNDAPVAGAEGTDCPPSFPGCNADAKASDDEASQAAAPAAPLAAYKRNWLSVAFEQDALLLPSANNTCAGGTGLQGYQSGQPQEYQAWKKTGLAFAALGGGAMYAITPATGVALEAKAMEMFPTSAPGFGLQLAYLVGL